MSVDHRQRFFIDQSPVRGELVSITHALAPIFARSHYPVALQLLLGEMLSGVSLLASTIKFTGRVSLQAQGRGLLKWAVAECSDSGDIRALADFDESVSFDEMQIKTANDALALLQGGVLFINIEPEHGQRYQGVIELNKPTLAGCLANYYDYSAQTPTKIVLASSTTVAAGLLIQLLPRNTDDEQSQVDDDLWPRVTMLTQTLKSEELLTLQTDDILTRLYHEEPVVLPDAEPLQFGCTCSRAKCEMALQQMGQETVESVLTEQPEIAMDCHFCASIYRFSATDCLQLFGKLPS